ncbi:uncharacterized protein JCM10292_005431 [Rhodotorula paludigena]|uniref:uncharacterized protein n=1 Tax=Rhodotorula paludigena TaxID=86838 RepID=UPI0031820C57
MAFGILEPRNVANPVDVPGTATLEETRNNDSDPFVKHAPGRPDLILVPTPSDDPCDPLNFSRARKEAAYLALLGGTVLAGTCGPLVAPAFVQLASELDRPLSQISQLNGSLVLTIGVGSAVFAPIQRKWGTRPSFLIAALFAFVSQIWAGASKTNYPSLLAARAVQGLAMGCYFNNVPAAVDSLFFVHERGLRISLWNACLVGGINLGPVISAQIIQAQDWTYAFWWQSLANGIVLLATVAFVPELIYDRSPYNAEVARRRELACPTSDKVSTEDKDAVLASVVAAPASKWSAYRLYTGVKTDEPFWRIAIRPFFYVTSPVVIWATLTFSVCFNLLPLAATVYSQIFSAPPYSLKVGSIGILSGIPPLIGTIIGTVLSGPGSDWIAKAMAKRNNGIYEPEFRLITMSLFLVFGGMGFYGWGLQTSESWIVPAVFIAILHVGVSAATISCVGYVTDAMREGAGDALALVVLIKSCIMFGLTFMINDWYATRGPRQFFVSLGSLVVATSALVVPAWIFGKRARLWFSQHNLL